MTQLYVIEDWAGNHLFKSHVFESFEDGWDFIAENFNEGSFEDVFVVPIVPLK